MRLMWQCCHEAPQRDAHNWRSWRNARNGPQRMKVLIPGALQSYTRASQVQAVGHTLDALFDDLDHRYPGLRFRVVDEQRMLRPNMRIFVNGVGVRDLQHALQPDDFVALVLALSGG
jgi:molybdopterin synthase sulfur carrier subunit